MNSEAEAYLPDLYQLLLARFDQEELAQLCFQLNISYDDLRGESRPARTRELLLGLARRDKLGELLSALGQLRPDAHWPPVPPGFSSQNLATAAAIDQFQDTYHSDHKPAGPSGGQAPQFNIGGEIRAAKVNIGGSETIQGDQHISLNFSEGDEDDAGRPGDSASES